jgi:hypothetical protein
MIRLEACRRAEDVFILKYLICPNGQHYLATTNKALPIKTIISPKRHISHTTKLTKRTSDALGVQTVRKKKRKNFKRTLFQNDLSGSDIIQVSGHASAEKRVPTYGTKKILRTANSPAKFKMRAPRKKVRRVTSVAL